MTEFYRLVLAVLVVWRVTHFLHAEDGPWEVSVRIRRKAGTGILGRVLDCFHCLSLWIAAPTAVLIGQSALERWLLWPAISAGAILIERTTDRAPAAIYREDEEK